MKSARTGSTLLPSAPLANLNPACPGRSGRQKSVRSLLWSGSFPASWHSDQ